MKHKKCQQVASEDKREEINEGLYKIIINEKVYSNSI